MRGETKQGDSGSRRWQHEDCGRPEEREGCRSESSKATEQESPEKGQREVEPPNKDGVKPSSVRTKAIKAAARGPTAGPEVRGAE